MTSLQPDLASSAVERVRASSIFQDLVSAGLVGTDSVYPAGWVFQRTRRAPATYRNVEGTGKACVVLSDRTSWAGPNQHNTARFPTLLVEVFADASRDSQGNVVADDADRRCKQVWDGLDRIFHDAANVSHVWPLGLKIFSCVRWTELSIDDVPDGDGSVRGTAYYAVQL